MLRVRIALAALAVVSAAIVACGSDSPTEVPPVPESEPTTYASSLNITLSTFTKTSYGLYYKDLTVGSGATVAKGDSLFVHYFGYFPTGVVFDFNPPTAAPFAFKVGEGRVIAAWDSAAVGMKVGGQREIIVPPSLGYGSTAHGSIPANSILVFVITAVSKK
jgi:FKBP-type peptidyl-prolyl cis-trans isomerase